MALGVTVDFNANLVRFEDQLNRLSGNLGQFQRNTENMAGNVNGILGKLGVGISIAGIAAFIKSGIDAADAMNDMADRTGIAVEKLAGFQLIAKTADTDLESFASSVNKLSINIAKNRGEFEALGVTAKDPAEAFLQLSDVFSGIEDDQTRAAFGAKVLGKSYAELAPILLQGSAALREQMQAGLELSNITEKNTKQAADFNDQWDTMQLRISSVSVAVAGPILDGFNQLISKIAEASSGAANFNRVLTGITNFAFQNDGIRGLSVEIDELNTKIVSQKELINQLESEVGLGGLIDGMLGYDASVEKNKLDRLIKDRDSAIQRLHDQNKEMLPQGSATSIGAGAVDKFLASGEDSSAKAVKKTANEAENLAKKYEEIIAARRREIDLMGVTSEVAKIQYDIQHGLYEGVNRDQQIRLQKLAYEKDALELNIEAYKEYDEVIAEGVRLSKIQSEEMSANLLRLSQKFDGPRLDLNAGIEDVASAKDAGLIDDKRAKAEYDKLGKAYNDSFIDPALRSTDKLSIFADQAARNMQGAFADFLFDPFNASLADMGASFLSTLGHMAAEAASSAILTSLFGAIGGGGAGGILGSLFASADGNVFNGGSLVPFAKGGVFDSPVTFPMRGGNVGLLGEAGPEAIMPLARGGDGKLGIRASVGAGSSNVSITTTVNVNNAKESGKDNYAGLGNVINAKIKAVIVDEKRPGGLLHNS